MNSSTANSTAIILNSIVALLLCLLFIRLQHQVNHLKSEVKCLKSPTSQTSSIGPITIHHGKVTGNNVLTLVNC